MTKSLELFLRYELDELDELLQPQRKSFKAVNQPLVNSNRIKTATETRVINRLSFSPMVAEGTFITTKKITTPKIRYLRNM